MTVVPYHPEKMTAESPSSQCEVAHLQICRDCVAKAMNGIDSTKY